MSNGSRSGLKATLGHFSGARHARPKCSKEHAHRACIADGPPTVCRGTERGLDVLGHTLGPQLRHLPGQTPRSLRLGLLTENGDFPRAHPDGSEGKHTREWWQP